MNEPTPSQSALKISTAKTATIYSNMCRGVMTSEEVILDFALNPNLNGRVLDEDIEISNRVVMSFSSAKRLLHLLHAMVNKHEETFGPVVLDVNERIKSHQASSGAPIAG